ncbi:helix-turn-helix domain-containing protein (plasmid) [Thermus sp. PS18]|uniref:helix-turn-helix domain-containing protein n=1 Tax=Thermus sp. PS18 TaxID=2849039 RepID=UPI0022645AD4|nr:helix-turn-helix domain-containing protein [Thermus sp. PS18]UZX16820.1 helix-turn-helix domain-containing protein [Thermus sp. PS18]
MELRVTPSPDFRELLERLEAAVKALERIAGTGPLQSHLPAEPQVGNRMGYSIHEVAHLTGLSKQTIYRAVYSGSLKAARIGRRYIVPRKALEEWLEGGG